MSDAKGTNESKDGAVGSDAAKDPAGGLAPSPGKPPVVDLGGGSMPRAAPNSKPREKEAHIETYVYRDFANAEPSTVGGEGEGEGNAPHQSLQSQKLPSKLAAMLQDPDLASIITWMPHGRSWKILNREMFSSFALPRYFGHSNHASFVRIVNAWGFRRISIGVDRDSYYHELFLRGKPRLHQRMKRLPSCHRKTPVDKDDRCPDFYELAKTSPLPEVTWGSNPSTNQTLPGQLMGGGSGPVVAPGSGFPPHFNPAMMAGGPFMPDSVKPIHFGDAAGAFASNGLMGAAGMAPGGMANNPMLSLLGINDQRAQGGQPADAASLNAYTQSLRRENENLMLKIKLLEYENQAKQQQLATGGGGKKQAGAGAMESNASAGGDAPASGTGGVGGAGNATSADPESANLPTHASV